MAAGERAQTSHGPELGQTGLPPGWRAHRLRHLATIRPSSVDKKSLPGQLPVRLCNYVDVYNNDLITAEMSFMSATATVDQVNAFSLREGDVLVTKDSEAADDIAVPAYVTEDMANVLCGYHLAVLRPKTGRVIGRFLAYAMRSLPVRAQAQVGANGVTRFGLPYLRLADIRLAAPDIHRQQAIADFLDRETEKIDALIAKKRRLIELLEERRVSMIGHSVTKGLDSDAAMNDAEADWLGEVPAHWSRTRLLYTIKSVKNGVWGDDPLGDGTDVYCVRAADFDRVHLEADLSKAPLRHVPHAQLAQHLLRRGDLVLEKSGGGDRQPVGQVVRFVAGKPSVCSNFAARMVISSGFSSRFILYLHTFLYGAGISTRAIKQNTGIQNLDSAAYLGTPVWIPTLEEQRGIADYLDTEMRRLDQAVMTAERIINTLYEYRSALITAAVTGQIDVREKELVS